MEKLYTNMSQQPKPIPKQLLVQLNFYRSIFIIEDNISGTDHVSFIIPIRDQLDKFLISIGREIVVVTWDGISEKPTEAKSIVEVDTEHDKLSNRFNDAKCDASGRLWAGTMGAQPVNGYVEPHKGSLYSLEPNGNLKKHLSDVGISNGLAWSSDNKYFYFIDTHKATVDRFDFDLITGSICNFSL